MAATEGSVRSSAGPAVCAHTVRSVAGAAEATTPSSASRVDGFAARAPSPRRLTTGVAAPGCRVSEAEAVAAREPLETVQAIMYVVPPAALPPAARRSACVAVLQCVVAVRSSEVQGAHAVSHAGESRSELQ